MKYKVLMAFNATGSMLGLNDIQESKTTPKSNEEALFAITTQSILRTPINKLNKYSCNNLESFKF